MDNIVSHLDITQIFCEVDDLCESFEKHWQEQPMLPSMPGERKSHSRMRLSEVMTIIIGFHGSKNDGVLECCHAGTWGFVEPYDKNWYKAFDGRYPRTEFGKGFLGLFATQQQAIDAIETAWGLKNAT